jgi:hypothetical protein
MERWREERQEVERLTSGGIIGRCRSERIKRV